MNKSANAGFDQKAVLIKEVNSFKIDPLNVPLSLTCFMSIH